MPNRTAVVTGIVLLLATLAYVAFRQLPHTGSAPPTEAATPAAVLPETALPKSGTALSNPETALPKPETAVPKPSTGPPKTRGLPPLADARTGTAVIPAFPWPPPAASAEHQIRNAWVSKGERTKLSDVAAKLEAALHDANYETWRYSSVPHGFALVTQVEQIKPDGTPRSGTERFRTDLPSLSGMTFVEYLKALAKAPPGYYRVIVFIVTDTPFARTDKRPTEAEAQLWLDAGLNQLPKSIGRAAL